LRTLHVKSTAAAATKATPAGFIRTLVAVAFLAAVNAIG
jgi:hypothetical protein